MTVQNYLKTSNYTEPTEIFEVQGSDALRWYFMSSNIVRGGDSRISDQGIDDVVRQIITPIWNAYSFFTLYANIDNYRADWNVESSNLLDQYILAKTRLMVETVTQSMDQYDLPRATSEIKAFIDALNNWYIRRSRDRFWAPGSPKDDTDKQAAYDTLFTVLKVLCQTSAPLLPMTSEEIYSGITDSTSVHLSNWPDASSLPSNPSLVKAMDLVRDIVSTTLRVREDASLRVRLPLTSITIAGEELSELEKYLDIIKDEVNVKEVILSDDIANHAQFILKPDGKILGPRLGKSVQDVFKAAKSGNWEWVSDERVQVGSHVLEGNEFSIHLEANEGITAGALATSNGVVILDTNVTEELINEGRARDTVRAIQEARKTQNLVVTDRIQVIIDAPESIQQAIDTHLPYIADQVLAVSIDFKAVDTEMMVHQGNIDGESISISLSASLQ